MQRFAVIGLGQFGARVAQSLTDLGAEVLAIDSSPQIIETWRTRVAHAIVLDATDEAAFRASGVDDVDSVVVAIGRDIEVSILVVAQLVRLAVPHILARASSALHEQILRLIGAHDVVNPEEAMGENVARRLVAPEMHERLILPTGHEWFEIDAPASFWGKTLGELELPATYGVNVIAIRKHRPHIDTEGKSVFKQEVVMQPDERDLIEEGDIVAIVATDAQIRDLTRA